MTWTSTRDAARPVARTATAIIPIEIGGMAMP
jgi:hypothetical protein